jgi:ribosomal protein S27AE
MSHEPVVERRRQRQCPSCGTASVLRGCRVPGVQIQVLTDDGQKRSAPIGLYSDVCMECGLTHFYARRHDVAEHIKQIETRG